MYISYMTLHCLLLLLHETTLPPLNAESSHRPLPHLVSFFLSIVGIAGPILRSVMSPQLPDCMISPTGISWQYITRLRMNGSITAIDHVVLPHQGSRQEQIFVLKEHWIEMYSTQLCNETGSLQFWLAHLAHPQP